ncbi:MAG: hypothetical protein AB2733_20410 [Candidatus Thiodiazotropha taylori]
MYFNQVPTSSTENHRHPGGGRDPEWLMVTVFLDSGLRRNDDNPQIRHKA